MKKVFSIVLVIACVFGLFACVAGVKDCLNIKDYKSVDGQTAEDGVATARDGVAQLKENFATYVDGVAQYEAGQITLKEGKIAFAEGQQTLKEGAATLAANTQAYNEGKEKLSKIEPLMPIINKYVELRDQGIAKLPGFSSLQAWFASVVRPLAGNLGLELPADDNDLPAFIQNMVVDGKAQLKQYEDGQVTLAEGKKALAAAEQQLADGEKQLTEADALLSQFEDGEAQLADGFQQLLDGMTASVTRDGKQVVPGLAELLGDGWSIDSSIYVKDESGKIVECRGKKLLDLDAATKFLDECDHYLDLSGADTTEEVVGRLLTCVFTGIAAVLGIIAGLIALVGNKSGFGSGLVCAILAALANGAGIFVGYGNLTYMPKDAAGNLNYAGDMQMAAAIILFVVAVIFVVLAGAKRKELKAAVTFDAAPAPAEVAGLKAENEELKEIIAKLAADETVKK